MKKLISLTLLTLLFFQFISAKEAVIINEISTGNDKTIGISDKTNKNDKETFGIGDKTFILNNKPFIVKAAEIHYPRIPMEYWEHRIQMCKALGMNTICIYIFWNIHEQNPGEFDFTGNNDIAQFCKIAQKNGMYVIVRPGPYVCAEWEMGGLPWWLLKKKDISLRDNDPYFMERVEIFENEVAKQLSPLTIENGGNIIMIQVENEYGSYAQNKEYISSIRDIIKKNYPNTQLFQCDWSSNFTLNGLDDLLWTMNFGTGANIDSQFSKLKELRPSTPLMCSEFWSGWFDNWGRKHETRDAQTMVSGLKEMLEKNISFSLYMTHGGSTFGHWGGANSPGYSPMCSSYDYDAPINESGQTTPKFFELRDMMKEFMPKGEKISSIPKAKNIISIPEFTFSKCAPLFDNLPSAKQSYDIKSMEDFDQGWGSILYRTTLPEIKGQSKLTISDVHDWAQIFIDGEKIGTLYRKNGEKEIVIPSVKKGAVLDILVEAMGRVNFGKAIKDYKGITDKVELSVDNDGFLFVSNLKNWQVYNLPSSYEFSLDKDFKSSSVLNVPGFYKATFKLNKVGDTFLDMRNFGKGLIWVNGHPMGRFWEVGPQQTIYMPGCWLKKGENEVLIFDIKGPKALKSSGLKEPILDMLILEKPVTNKKEGESLNLSKFTPAAKGNLKNSNGWQTIKLSKPQNGRYICLEAKSVHGNKDFVSIAEIYILGKDGKRISREPWKVRYADSEEINQGNYTADKVFDLQESTYWKTSEKDNMPHALIIDLGSAQEIYGFEYLPRMEKDIPGAIDGYNFYVSDDFFK
ncbi:MAG: beta-galactosidase [Bacteroidales bacterium]|nr:beta-galactosidase [Bacteroidales bacterium]